MKSDLQLQQDILAELRWDPSINAAHVGVEVDKGIVTLAGYVDSFTEKWSAEHAAQRVSGVAGLAIELDVKLEGLHHRSDADIAKAAKDALLWMTCFYPKDAVKIMVEHGYVTLSGEVPWEYQREAAASGIRHLLGVTGLSNKIILKPEVSLGAVKADIETALVRIAKADADKIAVEVAGDVVTLTGNVQSWAERESIKHAAWGTPGVRNVVDKIAVTY